MLPLVIANTLLVVWLVRSGFRYRDWLLFLTLMLIAALPYDTGIVMLRRMFQRQLDAVAAGRDPIGVAFDEDKAMVDFEAGNYLE